MAYKYASALGVFQMRSSNNMVTVLHILLLISLCVISQATYYGNCPYGWVAGPGSHCYYFSTKGLSWFEASFACNKNGGHLVRANNVEEIAFLKSEAIARGKGRNYWVGGTDYLKEKNWIWWPAQDPVAKYCNDWAPNEPNNYFSTQHCMQLWAKAGYKWDDQTCNVVQSYICERYPNSNKMCACSPKD